MAKPRIAKDFDKLSEELIAQIKMEYPNGFENNLITYTDAKGVKVSALPFETEAAYYLIKMTRMEAKRIIEEDEDYDSEGNLRDDFGDELEGAAEAGGDEEEEEDNYGDDPADEPAGDDDED